MAFAGKDAAPEKHTGMTYKGKEIILSKTRGRPLGGIEKRAGWFPDEKRTEVGTVYAFTGDIKKTSELTGVPPTTIRNWIHTTWFKAILEEIRQENNEKLDHVQTNIIHKAQDLILDRLENGDPKLTKTGEVVLVPVSVRDLALVSAITVDKRQIIRNKPTSITQTGSSEEQKLEKLKEFFTELVHKGRKKPETIENVEFSEINEGNDGGPADSDPESGYTEEQKPTEEATGT